MNRRSELACFNSLHSYGHDDKSLPTSASSPQSTAQLSAQSSASEYVTSEVATLQLLDL